MAKPDDRSNNAERIQNNIANTVKKVQDTADYLNEHASEISGEEINQLKHKNENRKQAISSLKQEYQDEANQ
ncbi:small acid-soluble spore protein Tlp [Paenibacillus aquistagni]|uniref:small acid-soluble spore protein Tlp n=1 Tax=Paenibacillus aquistagni TaxID=1852522 RepID=UPI00145AB765|nr:small acid-soluble spore protein Tlp [Paenibacillus aquistagni]NMM53432.1 small acid-soluble spore protein Tlp [Paenibacillus aquistagni]